MLELVPALVLAAGACDRVCVNAGIGVRVRVDVGVVVYVGV